MLWILLNNYIIVTVAGGNSLGSEMLVTFLSAVAIAGLFVVLYVVIAITFILLLIWYYRYCNYHWLFSNYILLFSSSTIAKL